MSKFTGVGKLNHQEANIEAQKIALGPFAFQAARIMRDRGILSLLKKSKLEGLTTVEIENQVEISKYGIGILLDAGHSIGIVEKNDGKWFLTKTGYYLENDKITKVNMDFTHDVCYEGLFYLEDSIDNSKPEGLKVFGKWDTVYEALVDLPPKVRESWFNFDHLFSDTSFPSALPVVFKNKPKKLMDIGGNTGKWALKSVEYDNNVEITILDLPGQLNEALDNAKKAGYENRVSGYEINLLDHSATFPEGYDAIWMSQFLDCFPGVDIVSILKRAKDALAPGGKVYIMETFVDRQKYSVAKYCLDMTSLYFTAIANGTSRMYHSTDMRAFVEEAGLKVVEEVDNIGISHSIMICE